MTEENEAKPTLIKYYKEALNSSQDKESFSSDVDLILERVYKNRGVYTVLITLSLYKILHPEQDIRQHKVNLPGGFSGRSFDTKYVTPTLKELDLPSMAESGWLTRSLEQDYPFDENFKGMITPSNLKTAFLNTVADIQKSQENAKNILVALLKGGIEFRDGNQVPIARVYSDKISIDKIVDLLKEHFTKKYGTHGGAKLPVLAFYAIYSVLIPEMSRFKDCELLPLGSHTASDRTSKSAGDIEVARDNKIFEALEIKLDKPVTPHMVKIAYEKINKFGVERYYILSGVPPLEDDIEEIHHMIFEIQQQHGCQLIVNGLYQTLKYYLRLVSSTQDFLNEYINLVQNDKELQPIHKEALQELIEKI